MPFYLNQQSNQSSNQAQSLNFNPQINVGAGNPLLSPETTNLVDQTSDLNQEANPDVALDFDYGGGGGGSDWVGSIFGDEDGGIQSNIPNDNDSSVNAGLLGGINPLVLIGGAIAAFYLFYKGGK